MYTVIRKKQDTLLVSITSRHIDRYSNIFYCYTQHKICNKNDPYISHHTSKMLLDYLVKP